MLIYFLKCQKYSQYGKIKEYILRHCFLFSGKPTFIRIIFPTLLARRKDPSDTFCEECSYKSFLSCIRTKPAITLFSSHPVYRNGFLELKEPSCMCVPLLWNSSPYLSTHQFLWHRFPQQWCSWCKDNDSSLQEMYTPRTLSGVSHLPISLELLRDSPSWSSW